jgi:translation initiation factor 3 subunit F
LETIANAKDVDSRTTTILSDVEALERAIEEVLSMIDRVSRYVESVMDEEAPASTALGQFLLNTLALAPKFETADIERDLYASCPSLITIEFFVLISDIATITFKMSSLCPTWPTLSAHKWNYLTD